MIQLLTLFLKCLVVELNFVRKIAISADDAATLSVTTRANDANRVSGCRGCCLRLLSRSPPLSHGVAAAFFQIQ